MQNKLLEHLHQLKVDTPALEGWTAEYAVPKALTEENFKMGVKRFIALANMPPEERERFYGSRFAGLYDNKDLAHLWNEQCLPEQTVTPHSIDGFKPSLWQIIGKDGALALQYRGTRPSKAFNQLLCGAIIDCGMFCQLGIWFGIRYMLGDAAFDRHFSRKPVLVTRFLYEGPTQGKEDGTNPLFDFFSTEPSQSGVAIEHIFNDPTYYYKHPGGNTSGQNVLITDDVYAIFQPLRFKSPMQRSDVLSDLVEAYNQAPDEHDAAAFVAFQDNMDLFASCYGSIYYFPESAFSWILSLRSDRGALNAYIIALDSTPECKTLVQTTFTEPDVNWQKNFYDAVLIAPAANQHKFEALFEHTCIKDTFKTLLESYPDVLNMYYQEVLNTLRIYHDKMREKTIEIDTLAANKVERHYGDIPSKLHFDLSKLLNELNETKDEAILPRNIQRTTTAGHTMSCSPLACTFFSSDESRDSSDKATSLKGVDPMANTLVTLPPKIPRVSTIFLHTGPALNPSEGHHEDASVSSVKPGLGASKKD